MRDIVALKLQVVVPQIVTCHRGGTLRDEEVVTGGGLDGTATSKQFLVGGDGSSCSRLGPRSRRLIETVAAERRRAGRRPTAEPSAVVSVE